MLLLFSHRCFVLIVAATSTLVKRRVTSSNCGVPSVSLPMRTYEIFSWLPRLLSSRVVSFCLLPILHQLAEFLSCVFSESVLWFCFIPCDLFYRASSSCCPLARTPRPLPVCWVQRSCSTSWCSKKRRRAKTSLSDCIQLHIIENCACILWFVMICGIFLLCWRLCCIASDFVCLCEYCVFFNMYLGSLGSLESFISFNWMISCIFFFLTI